MPRLSANDRQHLLADALALEGNLFLLAVQLARPQTGQLTLDAVTDTADYRSLMKAIKSSAGGEDDSQRDRAINLCLESLGLLLNQPGAEQLMAAAIESGLSASAPALHVLQLNAALGTREE